MPTIAINGAEIYYQAYGQDRPGQAPIVLIHGSTITGQEDWQTIAPLLARRWKVIVPDCRGHGQSTNPSLSYSFLQLADDTAALIRALGYEQAHVIGHSNGGNVALVTLLEHPDVVQSAVTQAANAWVSPDLIEIEPDKFDPERVAREDPRWMNSMIALHGPTHGPDYWRDLLRLTVQEIISQPNYTPEQLEQVRRPTLVIQGALDAVNAAAGHAQFIAEHIPAAELWLPQGIAHNVHLETPLEWLKTVESFLTRRGDEASDRLYRLEHERFSDSREGMFQVSVRRTADKISLYGQVLTEAMRQAAIEAAPPGQTVDAAGIKVMLSAGTPWALVNRPVTDLRREPRSLAERVSQALLGEAVRILDEAPDWSLVRMEHDGYIGWMHTPALQRSSFQEVQAYLAARRWRVAAELLPAYTRPNAEDDPTALAGKLPFAVLLPAEESLGEQVRVSLPDGRTWWVSRQGLIPKGQCPSCSDPEDVALTLDLMRRFIGVPYLWGGRSPFGYDCSGLAGAFYAFMDVQIPRDADQQFRDGKPVTDTPRPGDLLFFGEAQANSPRHAAVTHVAISLGGDEMIHANGAAWGVSYNSIDPTSPIYRAWLHNNLLGVRRFL